MKNEFTTPLMLAVLTIVNAWGLMMFQDFKDDIKMLNSNFMNHVSDHEIHSKYESCQ